MDEDALPWVCTQLLLWASEEGDDALLRTQAADDAIPAIWAELAPAWISEGHDADDGDTHDEAGGVAPGRAVGCLPACSCAPPGGSAAMRPS